MTAQRLDFIHVDDLADIHFKSLKYLKNLKIIKFVLAMEIYSIKQVVDTLLKNKT